MKDLESTLDNILQTWKGNKGVGELRKGLKRIYPGLRALPNYDVVYKWTAGWVCLEKSDANTMEIDLYSTRLSDLSRNLARLFRRLGTLGKYRIDDIEFKSEKVSYRRALRLTLIPQGALLAIITIVAVGLGKLFSVGLIGDILAPLGIITSYVLLAALLNKKAGEE